MRIVIHIGLHKTASTYLQQYIFPILGEDKLVYNPKDIFYFINSIFTLNLKDEYRISKARELAEKYRCLDDDRTLFISSEAISQLSFIQNYDEYLKLLRDIFGDVEIVLFIREQAAWLESCYRESIKHHCYQCIADFLNFDGSTFLACDHRLNGSGFFSMDVHKSDWFALIKTAKDYFPVTHVFLYEDFRKNNLLIINQLLSVIAHPPLSEAPQVFSNPGLSGKSINSLVSYHHLLRKLGIKKSTYVDIFLREREEVANHELFWWPGKPSRIVRFFRGLYKEPLRLVRRFSIYSVLRFLDARIPDRKAYKVLTDDMVMKIRAIHEPHNKRLEDILGRELPLEYKPKLK